MTVNQSLRQLIFEIEAEIEHYRQLASDVADSVTRFSKLNQINIHDLRGVAMLLTEIYMGAENLMLRVAKSLAESIPSGKTWHKELLEQLSTEVQGIRPTLFSQDTVKQLDEFRRFRHVVHHVYSFDYDWEQVRKLLIMAGPLLTKLIEDAQAFEVFLHSTMASEEKEEE